MSSAALQYEIDIPEHISSAEWMQRLRSRHAMKDFCLPKSLIILEEPCAVAGLNLRHGTAHSTYTHIKTNWRGEGERPF